MPCSVQDSARTIRANCEAAVSPTDGGPRNAAPPPRHPTRRAGADRTTTPPVSARIEALSRTDANGVAAPARASKTGAASRQPGMPRRHVQRTIAQLNAAAAAVVDLRRTTSPSPLRIPAAGPGRTTAPSPLQHELSPEWLALRKEVDDVTRMVDELLEVGEDGERKYRLT